MKLSLHILKPTVFELPTWKEIKENKALLFTWISPTEIPNIIFWRSITVRWRWPPIIWVSCFTDAED